MFEAKFTYRSESRMRELVAKANKPLAKLGLGAIQVLATAQRKVKTGETNALGEAIYVIVFDATLALPAELVKIQGQEVVARLQSIEGQNLITRLGGGEDLNLDAYREAPIECGHCGLKRNRNASWVVNDATRGLIQVGDSCVDLYFGIDVSAMLSTANTVFGILDSDECGTRRHNHYDFTAFASIVTWITMTSGFMTKKQAGDYSSNATALVADLLASPCLSQDRKVREDYDAKHAAHAAWRQENFKDENLLGTALDWWLERTDLTEFEHNCRLAILAQDARFLGLAAFGIKLWADAHFGAATRQTVVSTWVGEVKKREVFTHLKVARLASFDSDFGTRTVVTFEDVTGNVLVWKASGDPRVTLGACYDVKGTVKAHGDYKGVKQTTLTRCDLTECLEAAEALVEA